MVYNATERAVKQEHARPSHLGYISGQNLRDSYYFFTKECSKRERASNPTMTQPNETAINELGNGKKSQAPVCSVSIEGKLAAMKIAKAAGHNDKSMSSCNENPALPTENWIESVKKKLIPELEESSSGEVSLDPALEDEAPARLEALPNQAPSESVACCQTPQVSQQLPSQPQLTCFVPYQPTNQGLVQAMVPQNVLQSSGTGAAQPLSVVSFVPVLVGPVTETQKQQATVDAQPAPAPVSSKYTAGHHHRILLQHVYHDHAAEVAKTAGNQPHQQRRVRGTSIPFPSLLHIILKDPDVQDIIAWQIHGRAFLVKDSHRFAEEVMPRYFRTTTRYTSFQRQLATYGFLRLTRHNTPDHGAYYHEYFLRGYPELCDNMHRIKVKGHSVRPTNVAETEPDFYTMPYVGKPVSEAAAGKSSQLASETTVPWQTTVVPSSGMQLRPKRALPTSTMGLLPTSASRPLQEQHSLMESTDELNPEEALWVLQSLGSNYSSIDNTASGTSTGTIGSASNTMAV